jgi:hypothetical protein
LDKRLQEQHLIYTPFEAFPAYADLLHLPFSLVITAFSEAREETSRRAGPRPPTPMHMPHFRYFRGEILTKTDPVPWQAQQHSRMEIVPGNARRLGCIDLILN